MNIDLLKLLILIAIFGCGWLGAAVPLRERNARSPRFLSWGNAFAAGVFLGIGLMHMLGDASSTWTDRLGQSYPVALTLAGAAFLMLLWFEHVALGGRAHDDVHEAGGVPKHVGDATSVDADGPTESGLQLLYPYALIVALSVHSLIAGIALGAQTRLASVLLIFFAIAAHKSTAGFALGVSLARVGAPRSRALRLVTLFALMTPVGIVVGWGMTRALTGDAEVVFDAVFLSLAAGSFIYIAAFDIIRDEFLQPGPRLAKWLLAAAGYGSMALLALWL